MSNEHKIKSKYQDIKTEIIERLSDIESLSDVSRSYIKAIVVY